MKAILITLFTAMVPVLELRGAIPAGTAAGLDPWVAFCIALIGNMIPVPFIILFIRRIFQWLREKNEKLDKMVDKLEKRAMAKADTVLKYERLGLVILVAIPLPGTGAWTGALVAALLDIRLRDAVPLIALGVLIAGIIVMGLTYGVISL